VFKSAVYDVISPDLQMGPIAAAAEVIAVLDECLNAFPTLDQNCEIRISHAKSEHMSLPAKRRL
jgi:translation initiation factor 2-alpha kinase 4